MKHLIAALDDSAAARPVLAAAGRLAPLFGASVIAIHVSEDGDGRSAEAIADAAGVPFEAMRGDVVATLGSEVRDRDASALVIGSRGLPSGASPAGHVALELVQSLDRPVVVVPPHAADRPVRRVLVAVEGNGASHALRTLSSLEGFGVLGESSSPEVIALHVFETGDIPMFADSPAREADAFRREFMIRASAELVTDPSRLQLELRVGEAPDALCEAACELDADLVVLAWHCDLSEGHGRLVRAILAGAAMPVMLLPRVPGGDQSPGAV